MQVKAQDIFQNYDVLNVPMLAEFLRAQMEHGSQTHYQAGMKLHHYILKKPITLLDPFTDCHESKKLIRLLLENYLENAVPDFISTTHHSCPDPKRLLPYLYYHQDQYYFITASGFIRDRYKAPGQRIEFLDTLVGNGANGSVHKTATVIFDDADSYTLKTTQEKPRALKKVRVSYPDLLDYTDEIIALFHFPYTDYKLKACFYTYEQGQTYLYIPQRLIEGTSLFNFKTQHPYLATRETFDLAIAVGHAVQYMQEHQIIHRDLTPTNIMVTSSLPFTARVIDFGFAIFSATLPGLGLVCGTQSLAAPETLDDAVYNSKTDEYTAILSMLYCFSKNMNLTNKVDDKSTLVKSLKSHAFQQLPASLKHEIKQTFRAGLQNEQRASLQEVIDKLNTCKLILLSNTEDHPQLLSLHLQYTHHIIAKIKKRYPAQHPAMQTSHFTSYVMQQLQGKLPDNAACLSLLITALLAYNVPSCASKETLHQQLLKIKTLHDEISNHLLQANQYIDLLFATLKLLPKKSRINLAVQQFQENDVKIVTRLLTKEKETIQTKIHWLFDYDALELDKKLSILRAIYTLILYRSKQTTEHHAFSFVTNMRASQEKKYLYIYLDTLISDQVSNKEKCFTIVAMIRSPHLSNYFKSLLAEQKMSEALFIQLTGEDRATCNLAVQRINATVEDQKKHTAKP